MTQTEPVRCWMNNYSPNGEHSRCGRLALRIWNSRDGAIPVCEQCEAIVMEFDQEGKAQFIEFGFDNRIAR